MSATHNTRTPSKAHPKQIDRAEQHPFALVGINLPADAASVDVSAAVATWAATGGRNNTAVPAQLSTNIDMPGFVMSTTHPIQINDKTTGLVAADDTDNDKEIYARLTEAAGVYTLSFFKKDAAGADATVNLKAGDWNFTGLIYSFLFESVPADANIGIPAKALSQDPTSAGAPELERVAVTALNTIAPVTKTPKSGSMILVVNHLTYPEKTNPGITVSGQTITWDPLQMGGINLETTDQIDVTYYT